MTIAEATRNGRVAAFGQIFVEFDKMELRRDGRPVELTFLEFKVLKFFVQTPRRVVSRAELIRAVWPKRQRSTNRTVDIAYQSCGGSSKGILRSPFISEPSTASATSSCLLRRRTMFV